MRVAASALPTAGVVAAAVLTAACGGGGGPDFSHESATKILTATAADMEALKTLRMSGQLVTGGRTIRFDLQLTTHGDCRGTFRLPGGTAQVIASGGESWMRPDRSLWRKEVGGRPPAAEKRLGGKWVAMPPTSGLTSVCELDGFLDQLKHHGRDRQGSVHVVGTARVAGQDTVRVEDAGRRGGSTNGWISASDPHYLLKLQVSGSRGGTVTFSDFDSDVTITPPAPADVAPLKAPER